MSYQHSLVKPLRIVGLASHNSYGGAQSALRKLTDALAKRGHRAELWFLYRAHGEHVIEAPHARLLLPHPAEGVWGFSQAALALRRALRAARPDALVTFLPLANVLGQTLAATTGIRARVASQRNPGWTYDRLMRMLDKIAGTLGIYGSIVCVSEAVRQSFAQYPEVYRRRLVVVPNGLDLPLLRIDKAAARLASCIPLERFVRSSWPALRAEEPQAAARCRGTGPWRYLGARRRR